VRASCDAEEARAVATTSKTNQEARPAGAPTPTARPDGAASADDAGATTTMPKTAPVQDPTALKPSPGAPRPASKVMAMARVPGFAPLAPIVGWMTAWGVAAVAASCLLVAGLDLGLGLGIVDGAFGTDGTLPGLYLAAIQAGAFLLGGYAAARMARGRGLLHAVLAWALAMIATGLDTFLADSRNGESVLEPLFIPFWIDNGMKSGVEAALALGAFAVASLAGALIGGALGTAANQAATRTVTVPPGGKEPAQQVTTTKA
jgi:hypothetical protein